MLSDSVVARNNDILKRLVLEAKREYEKDAEHRVHIFMADVYGRLKGKPGVCLSTLGPGATNIITGVANANMDHSPLVAITGPVAPSWRKGGRHVKGRGPRDTYG